MQANLESVRAAEIYRCWRRFYFAVFFSFSAFTFTSTGINGKIAFNRRGQPCLEAVQDVAAAVNDNFILEQQCEYNSTLPHNLYDYFHWRKDMESFCT